MLLALKMISKFLQLLNSETAASQLAAGAAFGMIVGLSPFFTWHNLMIFLLVCLFRVNFAMFFLSTAVFAVLGFLLDPLFDALGYWLLVDVHSLRPLWIQIATAPILPFFRLNNTVVMGSLAFSLALFLPLFIFFTWAVIQYRKTWREKMKKSSWMRAVKATKVYSSFNKVYAQYVNLRDKWEKLT